MSERAQFETIIESSYTTYKQSIKSIGQKNSCRLRTLFLHQPSQGLLRFLAAKTFHVHLEHSYVWSS